ncbi:hypothetical protein AN958_04976 [Leucoagaricus sp. SymC.cos]|nr:hypothetical protein AN958_04976 [Leucoagaricus sp. SymC.cos]
MWPLFLDRSVTLHRRVRGSVFEVRGIFSDVESFVRLNPFAIRVEQDPENEQHYRITDRLPRLNRLWEYENTMEATFKPKEDEGGQGMDVTVTLPQRLVFPKLESHYRVKDANEAGVVEVSEVVELRVFCLLVPYILSNLTKAHRKVLDRLVDVVEGRN